MEPLKQYIFSVVLTALVCGILSSIIPGSKSWMKLLCGLVMTLTLVKPFSQIQDIDFDIFGDGLHQDGTYWSAQGEKITQNAMSDIITNNTEAYIMDKAKELGAHVEVEVSLNHDTIPVPISALLSGDAAPYVRLQIESCIIEDLGIPKENIRWKQQNANP